ncbi:PREDICTED: phospholipase SGR2-like isoform X3 [Nelumbo nucifera]|uniref:Phospholipase SGR2-like isoform X3 n=1 Tax=Nelumbo nucifera TaxID=4432 RepID=A0A1U8PZ72_NELNU|nr:PREDICTED: phospholipase SGR2-like isoform X3 [Nelumbo nucifera]
MLGATVHDVLYYMSPIYCQDIINSVSNQLNRLYTKFIKRNPGYDGKVDALKAKVAEPESKCQGHKEIGATIPKELPSHKLPCEQDETHKSHTPYIKYTKLEFKVDTFFAVGSPLGVFLSLRNIRIGTGKGQEYWKDEGISEEMPACRRMFNIFHPFDPVAYRVEPLICKEYISKRPVIIPYHRGGKRLHIGFQEFREDMAARSQAVMDHLKAVRVKVLTACQSRSTDDMEADSTDNDQMTEERSYGSIMMERLTGSVEDRVDYVLQDKTFQHPYISAIGSHTNYWRDHDTALFILKHLYSDIPEEPNSPELPSEGGSKSQRVPTRRFYQRDDMDEDLPLTFSDTIVVKEFSRKVRKAMKK